MREMTLTYNPADLRRFRRGMLWREWAQKYPSVFDEADVRLVAPRAPYGRLFGEWLAAAHYGRNGYNVLIGKYQFAKASPAKNETFRRIAPKPVVDLLTLGGTFGRRQGPDLFVYSKDEQDWFFAEVKRTDNVSPGQKELFAEIERCSAGKPIVIVRIVCVTTSANCGGSTTQCTGPGFPLLAPAGDRERSSQENDHGAERRH